MSFGVESSDSPQELVVEVFSELRQGIVQERWREVNVLLRLAMLSGLPMQFDATLNLLCDFAADMVAFEKVLVYFWEEAEEQVRARVSRGFDDEPRDGFARGNILNFWAAKFARPLIVYAGRNVQADSVLHSAGAASALIVPLMVSNRSLGSIQLFSRRPGAFSRDDAQLLWITSLIAENLLTREYANEGLIAFAFTDF